MKIVKLRAQNIKNLKAVEITPDGNIVRLLGKNGAGKSAVLDTIFTALTGKKIDDAIRHGEERAEVNVDMGEFKVRKIWTAKGERLEVTNAQGDQKKSPQTFLDELMGKLSFDPLQFLKMKQTEQLQVLKELCQLDFADMKDQQDKVYAERTELNVKIRDAVAQLKNIEAPDPKTPDQEISFKEQLEALNQLREKRDRYLAMKEEREEIVDRIINIDQTIVEKAREAKRLMDEIEQLKASRIDHDKDLAAFLLPPEVTAGQIQEVEANLEKIESDNAKIKAAVRYRTLTKNSEKLRVESDKLTERLGRIEQDKATRIANAKFPISGLSLSDDSVIFEGIPFNRLSTGQQIRVSTAIAMQLNPTVKVILIREGSLLDERGKQEIIAKAKEQDYQVWMEEVDDKGAVGFFIEDGSITKIEGQEIPEDGQEAQRSSAAV